MKRKIKFAPLDRGYEQASLVRPDFTDESRRSADFNALLKALYAEGYNLCVNAGVWYATGGPAGSFRVSGGGPHTVEKHFEVEIDFG